MERQELVDRLVTAVEEEDVLYTVFWLKEMKKAGLLEEGEAPEGIHLEHSWKNYSALVAAAMQPPSQYRIVILELLLLHVRDPAQTAALGVAMQLKLSWAVNIIREWTFGLRRKARHAIHLLTLDIGDAADYIDANFRPHPRADEMTGCGPLPPAPTTLPPPPSLAPPPIQPESSTVVQPVTPIPPSQPSLSNPSVRHSTADDARHLRARLPPLGGLASVNVLTASVVILGFSHEWTADVALKSLQQRKDSIIAQLEIDYQISIGHGPPPPAQTAPASSVAIPSVPTTPAAASAIQGPSNGSAAVRVFINNLPLDATMEEVQGLFTYAGVEVFALQDSQRVGTQYACYHGTVASGADYERAAAVLHRSSLRSYRIYINREAPRPHPSHPSVLVHGLPSSTAASAMLEAARRAGCGGYALRTQSNPDGIGAVGWMRVASSTTAELAVKYITGQMVHGATLSAEWSPAAIPAVAIPAGVSEQVPPTASAAVASSLPTPTSSTSPPAPQSAPPPAAMPPNPQTASKRVVPPPPPPLPSAAIEVLDLTDSPPAPSSLTLPVLDAELAHRPPSRTAASSRSSSLSRQPLGSGYPSPEPTPSVQGSPVTEGGRFYSPALGLGKRGRGEEEGEGLGEGRRISSSFRR
ncbi:hypothetical protein JCM6882_000649 [Rhodosporidiobolus microsporus]